MSAIECGFVSEHFLFRFGPTTYVAIGFDPNWDTGAGAPSLPLDPHLALVDTGAVESCIDEGLAERLELPALDRRTVTTVSGPLETTLYAVQVSLPGLGCTLHGAFFGVRLAGQPHVVLLGRDLLRYFTMVYDGRTGRVTLSNDE